MENISTVNFSLGKNQSDVTRKVIPNYPCDSYAPSSKAQKNVSFKGAGIFKVLLGCAETIPYEKFIEKGCTFVDGTALTEAGKKFTGSINVTQKDGTTYLLKYIDGLLKSSQKNLDTASVPDIEKIYKYTNGKLSQVKTFRFEREELRKMEVNRFGRMLARILKNIYRTTESKTIIDDKKVVTYISDFAKTAEGKRRAVLSDAEIKAKVKSLMDEAFENFGQDKRLMPAIVLKNKDIYSGGSYCTSTHTISINPESYRNGIVELESLVMHEVTHSQEAILRARLSPEKQKAAIIKVLLDKIANGEQEKILCSHNSTMTPPVMSEKMKKEFAAIAKERFYKKYGYADRDEIRTLAIKLLEDNHDFVCQYSSYDEALEKLQDYCQSHVSRYNRYLNKMHIGSIDVSQLPKLTPGEEKLALESVANTCDTLEGNAVNRLTASSHIGSGFDQYQFSPEEVLAQQYGLLFAIRKLQEQREKLLAAKAMTPQDEAYLTSTLDKLRTKLEYKTKGLGWYKNYTKSLNNPNDTKLKKLVKKGKAELDKLQEKIDEMPMSSLVYKNR